MNKGGVKLAMSIKDRFFDYWETDRRYEDYKYDLTIFEEMTYGIVGSIGIIIFFIVLVLGFPIWCLPYMIYKYFQINHSLYN